MADRTIAAGGSGPRRKRPTIAESGDVDPSGNYENAHNFGAIRRNESMDSYRDRQSQRAEKMSGLMKEFSDKPAEEWDNDMITEFRRKHRKQIESTEP